jgi:hypothetical protein
MLRNSQCRSWRCLSVATILPSREAAGKALGQSVPAPGHAESRMKVALA